MKFYAIGHFGITLKNINKQSRFVKEMFHGTFLFNDGIDSYYKNINITGDIAMPSNDFVVTKVVYALLKSIENITFIKLERLSLFDFDFLNNDDEAFHFKLAQEPDYSDYFEELKLIDSRKFEFYKMCLERIDNVSDNNLVKIKELDGWKMYFDKAKTANLEKLKAFTYSRVSFFNEEIYSIIKPYLNMDFFEVVEVGIPVVSVN